MSYGVIHILLLDGKVLCVESKNKKTKVLFKILCKLLQIKSCDTFGLTYKDSRGMEQWMDESKLISDHDIVPNDQILQLIVRIRFIPHHVCQDETSIHQLMLVAIRLLRQNWFLAQPEIHSQLLALYLLYTGGTNISDADIHSTLIRGNMSMLDPVTKDNYFDTILDAYKIYRDKLESTADFSLKFLQLMMQFPIFNSRLFVVANFKGDKFLFGVNSVSMTIFYLDSYHEPLKKIDFKHVDNVMRRDIKIIISLGDKMKNQRNIIENETIVYFALSTHQSDCIYAEILTCWDKCKNAAPLFTINQLRRDETFKKRLNRWLSADNNVSQNFYEYHSDGIDIHLISIDEIDQISSEQYFGELNMYDNDIYHKLATNHENSQINKPIPDIEQLLTEKDQLTTILYEKMNELNLNFSNEKELTGVMPAEYAVYFPSGNNRFTRNSNHFTASRQSHKGCAAEVKNKLLNSHNWTLSRAMSRDNLTYHSSNHIKGSLSPSILANRIPTSHSVSDLRLMNSSIRSSEDSQQNSEKQYTSRAASPYTINYNVRDTFNQSPLISGVHQRNAHSASAHLKFPDRPVKRHLNSKY